MMINVLSYTRCGYPSFRLFEFRDQICARQYFHAEVFEIIELFDPDAKKERPVVAKLPPAAELQIRAVVSIRAVDSVAVSTIPLEDSLERSNSVQFKSSNSASGPLVRKKFFNIQNRSNNALNPVAASAFDRSGQVVNGSDPFESRSTSGCHAVTVARDNLAASPMGLAFHEQWPCQNHPDL